MSQKVRRVLLALLFGLAQLIGLGLVVVLWYYLGRTEFAIELMEYTNPESLTTIEYIGTGFVIFLLTCCILVIIGALGFIIYHWGKFTQKKATKWNRKINYKISARREKKRIRASLAPDWEV